MTKPDILDQLFRRMGAAEARRAANTARVANLIAVSLGKHQSDEAKAHHEAGHVLAGVSLGRKLKGGVRLGDESDVDFWARADTNDERRKERIRIAIAGPIAEAQRVGSSAGGGADLPLAFDLTSQLACAKDQKPLELTRMAAQVRAILRAAPVRRLARTILRQRTLSKGQVMAELARLGWPRRR